MTVGTGNNLNNPNNLHMEVIDAIEVISCAAVILEIAPVQFFQLNAIFLLE